VEAPITARDWGLKIGSKKLGLSISRVKIQVNLKNEGWRFQVS
jgi:hypothetical protein